MASFIFYIMDFQVISAIVFIVLLSAFLWFKRKKLDMQKILFPILYFVLYRTKYGLKLMKRTSKKFPKFWKIFSVVGVIVGFLGMIFITYQLSISLWQMFANPESAPGVAPVLPIPVKGAIYVPFFHWILSIFFIALVHEFSHGIIATLHGIKIKSSGFAFLGIGLPIIPAAFVEPDEEQLEKKSKWKQLGVFAAGPFANIILGILSLCVIMFMINPLLVNVTEQTGVVLHTISDDSPADLAGLKTDDLIFQVDNNETLTSEQFQAYIATKKPDEVIKLHTKDKVFELKLGQNSEDENKPYVGITFTSKTDFKESFTEKYGAFTPKFISWFSEFFFWMYLLNVGIGLFNLVPLGPVDGGRMLRVLLLAIMPKKPAEKIWKIVSFIFLGIILYMLVSAFI